jgi:hypothetical protein
MTKSVISDGCARLDPPSGRRGSAKWDKPRHGTPQSATVVRAKTQQAQAPGTTLARLRGLPRPGIGGSGR